MTHIGEQPERRALGDVQGHGQVAQPDIGMPVDVDQRPTGVGEQTLGFMHTL